MSISLIASPNGLFTRLGVINRLINTIDGARGLIAPNTGGDTWGASGPQIFDLDHAIKNIYAQYTTAGVLDQIDLSSVIAQVRQQMQQGCQSAKQALISLAQQTLVQMVNDDAVTNGDFPVADGQLATALAILINQMIGTGTPQAPQYYIVQPTVSVTPGSITTNYSSTWQLVGSVKNGYGLQNDYVVAENLYVSAQNDASSGATAGSETLAIKGLAAGNPNDFITPGPLGVGQTMQMCDPTLTGVNVLTNSNFQLDATTANLPDGWAAQTGTVGTAILVPASNPYYTNNSDANSLEFASDGATAIAITQTFANQYTGTSNGQSLQVETPYACGIWAKVSSTASLVAGVLAVELIDSNGGGTIVQDDAGVNNSFTVLYSALTTSYQFFSGFFRLPGSLDAYTLPLKIRVRQSTAFTNAKNVFIGGLGLCKATSVYPGGPCFAAFRGNVDAGTSGQGGLQADYFKCVVANNWLTASFWAKMLQEVFDLRSKGLTIPSSTSSPAYVLENLTN